MKSALLSKLALCACPPAVIATTAMTVAPVRRAVHHLTSAPKPHATAHAGPVRSARAAVPCPAEAPVFAMAAPIDTTPPPESALSAVTPTGGTSSGGTVPFSGPPALTNLGPGLLPGTSGTPGTGGTTPTSPDTPITPPIVPPVTPVPEPAAWLMMIAGMGAVGFGLRRSRAPARSAMVTRTGRFASVAGSIAAMGNAPSPAGSGVHGAVAQIGAKSATSALLAKTAMCVCPAAMMTTAAVTIPPVRHAVYQATAPRTAAPLVAAPAAVPCVPAAPAVLSAVPAQQIRFVYPLNALAADRLPVSSS